MCALHKLAPGITKTHNICRLFAKLDGATYIRGKKEPSKSSFTNVAFDIKPTEHINIQPAVILQGNMTVNTTFRNTERLFS